MTDRPEATAAARPSILRLALPWIVVWLALGVGLVWLAGSLDWRAAWMAATAADPKWVLAAFACSILGLPLWTFAWRALLVAPPAFAPLFATQAVTLAAIQGLSVIGGGGIGAWLLARRLGLSAGAVVSILALDQTLTGLVKITIVGVAFTLAPVPTEIRAVVAGILAAILALAFAVFALSHADRLGARLARGRSGAAARLWAIGADFAMGLAAARSPRRFSAAFCFYLTRRLFDGAAILCVQQACGFPVSLQTGLLVLASVSLASVIPGPPGSVGLYEAAVMLAYAAVGVAPEKALALALVQHVAYLAAMVLPGIVTLAIAPPWRSDAKR